MARFDYSINVVGQISNLEELKKQLSGETFNIKIKLDSSSKEVIRELHQLAVDLTNAFANLGNIAGSVRNGGKSGGGGVKVAGISDNEQASAAAIASYERQRTTMLKGLNTQIQLGEEGLFQFQGGEVVAQKFEEVKKNLEDIRATSESTNGNIAEWKIKLNESATELNNINKEWELVKSSAKGTNIEAEQLKQTLEATRLESTKQGLTGQIKDKLNSGNRLKIFGTENGIALKKQYEDLLTQTQQITIGNKNYQQSIVAIQSELKRLTPIHKQLQRETQKTTGVTDSFATVVRKKLANATAYRVIFSIFNTIRTAMSSLYHTTIDINTELRDINKVLDLNDSQLSSLTVKANELANAYARTTVEVLNAMESFAKAGFTVSQTIDLAELSIKLQNVGDLTASAASQFLVAANAAFQMNGDAKKLAETIDIVNNLSNNAAVTVEFLSEALKVGGAVAHSAGLSLEEFASMATTVGEATQRSGREVGNGLKTIILRLTQVNDTADGANESISNADKALESVGIKVRDTANSFRPAMETLTELAKKWNTLSDVQQRYITYNLAGVYRSNILESFLANINEYEENLYTSLNSVGSATKENELYMNSLEAGIKKVTAAWESFVVKIKASKVISFILNGIAFVMRNLETAIIGIGISLAVIYRMQLQKWFLSVVKGIKSLVSTLFATKKATDAAAASATAAKASIAPVLTLIIAITTAIMLLTDAHKKAQEEEKKAIAESLTATNELIGQYGQLNMITRQYEQLREQYRLTGEGVEELRDLQAQLNEQFREQTIGVDLVNGSYESQIKLIEELKRKKAEEVYESGRAGYTLAQDYMTRKLKDNQYGTAGSILNRYTDRVSPTGEKSKYDEKYSLKNLGEELGLDYSFSERKVRYGNDKIDWSLNRQDMIKYLQAVVDGLNSDIEGTTGKKREGLLKELEDASTALTNITNDTQDSVKSMESQLGAFKSFANTMVSGEIVKLQGYEKTLYDSITESLELSDLSNAGLAKYTEDVRKVATILDNIDVNNFEEKWKAILGIFPDLTEEDKKAYFDSLGNYATQLSDLDSEAQEINSELQQRVNQLKAQSKAEGNLYDLRREIATDAGLTDEEYKDFALSGNASSISDPRLQSLAKEVESDYAKYIEDINKSEAEGLNNQEAITTLYETQVELKQKQLEILKKELNLEEKRKALNTLESERNQISFINGQRVYVADYEAVEKERQSLLEAEQESAKSQSELETGGKLAENEVEFTKIVTNIEGYNQALKDGDAALISFIDKIGKTGIYADELSNVFGRMKNLITKAQEEGKEPKGGIKIDTVVVNGVDNLQGIADELYKKTGQVTPW